jgi:hypothetical protein
MRMCFRRSYRRKTLRSKWKMPGEQLRKTN